MLVTCENCNTSFNLDESLVKSAGSKVRCSRCKHIFVIYPPEPAEDELSDAVGQDIEALPEEQTEYFRSTDEQNLEAGGQGGTDSSNETMFEETDRGDAEGDDLDLSDIEKMLAMEDESDEVFAAESTLPMDGVDDEVGSDSLDLSDFEKILDEEEDKEELLEDKNDEEQDLVFDLNEDLETEAGEDQLSPTSELDLGDLEKMFEEEAETPDLSMEEEPSLSFESEADDNDQTLLGDTEKGDVSGDLEFEMEEESPEAEQEEGVAELNFDMEPVEAEDEDFQSASNEEVSTIDFGLDLELESEGDSPSSETSVLEMPDGENAPDLSELDDVFGIAETTDDQLEMTSEPEEEFNKAAEKADKELDVGGEALDENSFDDEIPDFDEEAEMDFPDDAVPDIPDEDEVLVDEASVARQENLEEEQDDSDAMYPLATPGAGLKKILISLIVIVFVMIVAVTALVFLQFRGVVNIPYLDHVSIPFLSKLESAQPADMGNLKIATSDVASRFLDGTKAGRLFIVTGNVKNDYSQPRSFIQVSGSLYIKGKMLAKTATAYCGNVIPDLALSQMSVAEIDARLDNRSGERDTNVNVKPGEERPFMVVFSDLPESLEEFTVTVVGSSAGGK